MDLGSIYHFFLCVHALAFYDVSLKVFDVVVHIGSGIIRTLVVLESQNIPGCVIVVIQLYSVAVLLREDSVPLTYNLTCFVDLQLYRQYATHKLQVPISSDKLSKGLPYVNLQT